MQLFGGDSFTCQRGRWRSQGKTVVSLFLWQRTREDRGLPPSPFGLRTGKHDRAYGNAPTLSAG
jgi:hypothetical protein